MLDLIENTSGFLSLENKLKAAISESKKLIVLGDEHLNLVGIYIKNFTEINKEIEKYRVELIAPFNEKIKKINNFFKDFISESDTEQKRLKKEVEDYLVGKREEIKGREQKEQRELEDAIIQDAEMFNDESLLNNIPKIEIKTEKLGDITENITSVRSKEWRVIDKELIPIEYLIEDERKINSLRKEYDFKDKSPISGIEFFYKENIRIK